MLAEMIVQLLAKLFNQAVQPGSLLKLLAQLFAQLLAILLAQLFPSCLAIQDAS